MHPGIVEKNLEPFTATQCEKLEDLLHTQEEEEDENNNKDGLFMEDDERNGFISDHTEETVSDAIFFFKLAGLFGVKN